jgi:catechol 2,3-dioxygenase-like lactoylglutathione lyase family enzyme
MKVKSVSGVGCLVKELGRTAKFYQALGFEVKKREPGLITVYMNWFWMEFHAKGGATAGDLAKDARIAKKGPGLTLYLSVENVDAFYKFLVSKGIKPASAPRDEPWGNREFQLRDPDGYRLVIFRRK